MKSLRKYGKNRKTKRTLNKKTKRRTLNRKPKKNLNRKTKRRTIKGGWPWSQETNPDYYNKDVSVLIGSDDQSENAIQKEYTGKIIKHFRELPRNDSQTSLASTAVSSEDENDDEFSEISLDNTEDEKKQQKLKEELERKTEEMNTLNRANAVEQWKLTGKREENDLKKEMSKFKKDMGDIYEQKIYENKNITDKNVQDIICIIEKNKSIHYFRSLQRIYNKNPNDESLVSIAKFLSTSLYSTASEIYYSVLNELNIIQDKSNIEEMKKLIVKIIFDTVIDNIKSDNEELNIQEIENRIKYKYRFSFMFNKKKKEEVIKEETKKELNKKRDENISNKITYNMRETLLPHLCHLKNPSHVNEKEYGECVKNVIEELDLSDVRFGKCPNN